MFTAVNVCRTKETSDNMFSTRGHQRSSSEMLSSFVPNERTFKYPKAKYKEKKCALADVFFNSHLACNKAATKNYFSYQPIK